ncbi:hypothetical protein [Hyphomicrobium sp. DY-1]|uniref:hypothetical protein n=1 Tax=Hyphomicrobium sp. DY-1 TaxID=3075650 RepID=UPI0039C487FF
MISARLRLRLLWLTLFAFGVQMAVADFHHHISRGTGIESRAMTAGMCRPSNDHPCAPHQHDHDGCILCWATAIAATSLTPVSFDMPLPAVAHGIRLQADEPQTVSLARLTEVRARGPPPIALG